MNKIQKVFLSLNKIEKTKRQWRAPARWLSWLERHPMHGNVVGSVPRQGTYPGGGFDPRLGHVLEGNQLIFLSHINLSLKSVNMS